jgi:hypothetical protein
MRLIDHLRSEIKKTGYPLEIEISGLLDGKWDTIVNTDSYYDKAENKTRDIDINASRRIFTEKEKILFIPHITIECKKSENLAWVFFMRPVKWKSSDWKGSTFAKNVSGHYIDGFQSVNKSTAWCEPRDSILDSANLHYGNYRKVAVCFTGITVQGKQNESRRNEIFEAENQVKKYIVDKNELYLKTDIIIPTFIEFHFPCVVFDGKIFEATIEKGKIGLKNSLHVPLVTFCPSAYQAWDLAFIIDFVHRSYVDKFLALVDKDINSMTQVIVKDEERIYSWLNRAFEHKKSFEK